MSQHADHAAEITTGAGIGARACPLTPRLMHRSPVIGRLVALRDRPSIFPKRAVPPICVVTLVQKVEVRAARERAFCTPLPASGAA